MSTFTFTLKPERPDALNMMIGIPTFGDRLYDRLTILLLQLGLQLQRTGRLQCQMVKSWSG